MAQADRQVYWFYPELNMFLDRDTQFIIQPKTGYIEVRGYWTGKEVIQLTSEQEETGRSLGFRIAKFETFAKIPSDPHMVGRLFALKNVFKGPFPIQPIRINVRPFETELKLYLDESNFVVTMVTPTMVGVYGYWNGASVLPLTEAQVAVIKCIGYVPLKYEDMPKRETKTIPEITTPKADTVPAPSVPAPSVPASTPEAKTIPETHTPKADSISAHIPGLNQFLADMPTFPAKPTLSALPPPLPEVGTLTVVVHDEALELFRSPDTNFIVRETSPGTVGVYGFWNGNAIVPLTAAQVDQAKAIGLVILNHDDLPKRDSDPSQVFDLPKVNAPTWSLKYTEGPLEIPVLEAVFDDGSYVKSAVTRVPYPTTVSDLIKKIRQNGTEVDHLNLIQLLEPSRDHLWSMEINANRMYTHQFSLDEFFETYDIAQDCHVKISRKLVSKNEGSIHYSFRHEEPGRIHCYDDDSDDEDATYDTCYKAKFVLYPDRGYVILKSDCDEHLDVRKTRQFSAAGWMAIFGSRDNRFD